MKFIKTAIPDVHIIEPSVFRDDRGYFLESFNLEKFEENIYPIKFVQDNESKSSKGVLRGLHFQKPPFDQAKLVRCIKGRVMDVALDIRKGSLTYGNHIAVELSEENKRQLFLPRGFAHGYVVLSESAVFAYKVDNKYAPEYVSGIRFDDKTVNIDWGIANEEVILSEKDKNLAFFKDLDSPLNFKNMNILVTGSNGQLGSEIKNLAANYDSFSFFFMDLPDLDICNKNQIDVFFKDKDINTVINCAAYTAVDKAEQDADIAKKVNVTGSF